MKPGVQAARAAGLRALVALQSADGSFPLQFWWGPRDLFGRIVTRVLRRLGRAPQTPTGPVMEQDPTFATSYILMGAGRWLPRQSISRAGEFLLAKRDRTGQWSWGEVFGTLLPTDSDANSCALAALALNRFPLDRAAEAERLRRFWRPDLRRFSTWTAEGPFSIPERDEPVANANVLFALNALGHPPTPSERAGVSEYLASCHSGSRYYCAPATIAHAAHRAGLDPQCLPRVATVRPDRNDLIGTIQWLCAGHVGDRLATERVLAAQQADGSWPSLAWINGVGMPFWGSSAVTTALAIEALGPPDSP